MEELELLLNGPIEKAISTLTAGKKSSEDIEKYIKEFKELDRSIRLSQVDNIQKDKNVGSGEKAKVVKAIRSKVNYQKKIVTTATAFEVGEPVTLLPNEENDLTNEILRLWDENRIDDKIQKAKIVQKSQTECAIQFYLKDVLNEEDKKVKGIKLKLLTNENGTMAPYFDSTGDMIAFVWSFSSLDKEGKTLKNTWIFTEKDCYKCSDSTGNFILDEKLPHGFNKIPIVYISQDEPEWFDVESLIDRYETALSKLGASNDYAGYPLMKLYGEVTSMPDRNDDGKTLRFPMKEVDNESGKTIHGDAEFMTNSNAPESVKLEMETVESLIYSISHTPNLSFDNLKGSVGNISGVALKLLFLDSIIKAKMNEGDNRTMIQRIIKLLISGITTTTLTNLKSKAKETIIKVKFNSILPDDVMEAVEVATKAKEAGLMSTKTGVEYIDLASNITEEIATIDLENKVKVLE